MFLKAKKGKYYKYRIEKEAHDDITPILNVEALETFISEKQYEAIPDVFPEDFSDIPNVPSMLDMFRDMVFTDINERGYKNILLMKREGEDIDFVMVTIIYSAIMMILVALGYVLKEMGNELGGGSSKTKSKKVKKN